MAQNEPLHIDAGATYTRQFTYAKDSGTYSVDTNAKVVVRDLDGTAVLTVTPDFNRTTGDIGFTLSPAQTASLDQPRYRWALELISDTETIRLLQGRVSVSADVVK